MPNSAKPLARRSSGFTMLELIVVVAIIAILVAIVLPLYSIHLRHAREAKLLEELHTLRQMIAIYAQTKDHGPSALSDLVSAGYMPSLPKDPFTNSSETWEPVSDETISALLQSDSGITDVHSGSKEIGSDGKPYNTW